MRGWVVAALAGLLLATLPVVGAESGFTNCWDGETDATAVPIGEDAYLRKAGPVKTEVWQESNGLDGLQRTERWCNNGPGTLTHLARARDTLKALVGPPCIGLICAL